LGTGDPEFSRADVVKLQTLGFTPEQVLESVVVTAFNNFANTLSMGLGIEPDFAPPPVFAETKVHLSPAAHTPIQQRQEVVHVSGTLQDADADLVAQAQNGQLEAFETLVRRHTRLIYRTLTAILGDPIDAQDAMQDTLLSAFKNISGFQGRAKFSTWLGRISRNTGVQR